MLSFNKNKQPAFGIISADDDGDIEILKIKHETHRGVLSESFLLIRDLILVLAVFVLMGVFIAQPVVVEGTSMLPNLHDGERLLVNKLIYYKFKSVSWGHLERGDMVVFWFPNNPDTSYVKRVIGLPGEKVEVKNGKVFIDDKELIEPYLDTTLNQGLANSKLVTVSDHHYFVMGDNRDNSSDSRYWGLVPEKYIYGKAFFRYWSPSQVGILRKGECKIAGAEGQGHIAGNEDPGR